jgi:hypothetical protein
MQGARKTHFARIKIARLFYCVKGKIGKSPRRGGERELYGGIGNALTREGEE